MEEHKKIIDDIRKIRFGIGLDITNTSEDIRKHIEENIKIREDAARLVSDLYTKKTHFILELIQNAEDNDYDENISPMLNIIIQDDKLILRNNEKGFNKENVRALCGIGTTTKQNKKAGYIGEKGIGFKSVFMVAKEVTIYSNGFQFKFEYDANNPLSIIIPQWVDDIPSFVEQDKTNIVLQLKSEVKEEITELTQKIDQHLLLFLRKLEAIEFEDKNQNKSWKIERYDLDGKVEIVHPRGQNCWKIVKSLFKVPSEVQEEKRKEIIETEIVLGFPLKPDGSAETSTTQNIFAFLPVRSYGFKFIIQADFLVPPSREDIHKDKSWNLWLRDNVATVFLKAVEEFKLDEKLKKTYYDYIPLTSEITDTFFSPVVKQIQNNLREAKCLLTESNGWRKPYEVYRADNDTRALITNDVLNKFFNKEYISPDIKVNKEILDELGVPEFEFSDLVQCLQKEEWLINQSDEWFTRLYAYLNHKVLEDKQIEAIKKLKIIRLESNELTSPSESNIFFPLDKKSNYGFEAELRVIKRTLLETKEKVTRESIVKFLKKLGIRDAQPYDIIENHILPMYESDKWKSKNSETLLGYIRYIKDNLLDYEKESDKRLNGDKGIWRNKEDPLKRLKESLFIRSNKTVDGVNNYSRPEDLYLPRTYDNNNDLEFLFEGIESILFVHREYIDDIIRKYRQAKRKSKKVRADIQKKRAEEIKEWKDFFVKLGVNTKPKIIKKQEVREHHTYCNIHKKNVHIFSSPDICSIVRLQDPKKSKILLNILVHNWDYYKDFVEYTDFYFSRSWIPLRIESDWFRTVKETKWLPTSKGTLARPSEIFLDKPEIRELLGDSVLYLAVDIKNEEFIKTLGINTEASIESVIINLKSLKEQRCQEITLYTKFYDYLNKKFEGNEYAIKTAFSENSIIYLPNTTKNYFTSREVLWKDVSFVFGEIRGYLEKQYPKLKSFFVEKLGVSEKPTPKDYAGVLLDLSQKKEITEKDEKIILKIYSELNDNLNPEFNEHLISKEVWWKDFVNKPIFWTDKNKFCNKDENLFVNDEPELYELFKESPQIAFLKLPGNYYPKIQYFISEASISFLSQSVEMRLATSEGKKIEENLTEQIRKFTPYILRYIYKLDYDIYERLKKDKTFTQLKNLSVFSVDTLQVEYILKNCQSIITQRNAILYDGNLYVQKEYKEDIDRLAVELSKLFGVVSGLDDFLILLFDKKSEEKIENLLRVKGIQELPEEEKEWFGVVDQVREVLEEGLETIVENKPPTTHIHGVPPTPTLTETPEVPGNDIVQEPIEEEDWQPECKPTETETNFEVIQSGEKAGQTITEREKQNGKPQTLPKPQKEKGKERDTLSPKVKIKIGRWGEEYALKCLKDILNKDYPTGKVEDTSDGFTIRHNDKLIVEVHWLNTIEDRGEGYDIKVVENNIEKYIEVKSTKTDTKDWFDVSEKQWEFMKEKGDKYYIYRVYNAGTKEAKLTVIPNPYKKWKEGNITAYTIRIQI